MENSLHYIDDVSGLEKEIQITEQKGLDSNNPIWKFFQDDNALRETFEALGNRFVTTHELQQVYTSLSLNELKSDFKAYLDQISQAEARVLKALEKNGYIAKNREDNTVQIYLDGPKSKTLSLIEKDLLVFLNGKGYFRQELAKVNYDTPESKHKMLISIEKSPKGFSIKNITIESYQ